MTYTPVNWKDGQAGGTPVSAENLGRMDRGIADLSATGPMGGTAQVIPQALPSIDGGGGIMVPFARLVQSGGLTLVKDGVMLPRTGVWSLAAYLRLRTGWSALTLQVLNASTGVTYTTLALSTMAKADQGVYGDFTLPSMAVTASAGETLALRLVNTTGTSTGTTPIRVDWAGHLTAQYLGPMA